MMYLLSVAIDQSVVLLEYDVYVNYWKNASSILQQMRITNASGQNSSINSVAVYMYLVIITDQLLQQRISEFCLNRVNGTGSCC